MSEKTSDRAQMTAIQQVPKVVRTVGTCGGRARLDGTRICVWVLESLWQQGLSADEIVAMYPMLTRQQVDYALDWAERNVEEIESDIRAHESG
jgi:uncharacterized protein (DUF433 family)